MSDASRERRAKQTVNNLIYSLLVTAGIVLVMVMITPRPSQSLLKPVDYVAVAKQASESSGAPVVAPKLLGKGWYSNSAYWRTKNADGVDTWSVGFVGPNNQYLAITQGFKTNPTWSVLQLKGCLPQGARVIGGRTFTVWKSTVQNNPRQSHDYSLVTDITTKTGTDQVIVYGTAGYAQLNRLAALVARQLDVLYP